MSRHLAALEDLAAAAAPPGGRRHLDALEGLALSSKDLTRIENLAREMKNNAWGLEQKAAQHADQVAGKVRGALLVSAGVTAASTALLIGATVLARRGAARG